MFKTTSIVLLLSALVLGCTSSEKLLQKGQYERAIDRSIKKLIKNPGNEGEFYVLSEAYSKANSFDMDRITFLEKEDIKENFLDIFTLYQRLDTRQDKIKTLPSSLMNEFEIIDYDDELIASKEQAAEVSYQRGLEYLKIGDRESARQAFFEFEQVLSIYSEYKDTQIKIEEALTLGINQVLFVIENNSETILPKRFDEELKKIGLADLNGRWIQYSVYEDEEVNYDYFIVLDIRDISVSPERIDRETYKESAEIQDGTKYVFDERGNVKKDSLGNDIREPNIVTVTAEISKARQWKEAFVGGSMDYIDLRTDQLVKTEDISVSALFEHFSASFSGDERALSNDSKELIEDEIVVFPSSEIMFIDSATLLKEQAKEIMYRNRGLLSSTES